MKIVDDRVTIWKRYGNGWKRSWSWYHRGYGPAPTGHNYPVPATLNVAILSTAIQDIIECPDVSLDIECDVINILVCGWQF